MVSLFKIRQHFVGDATLNPQSISQNQHTHTAISRETQYKNKSKNKISL